MKRFLILFLFTCETVPLMFIDADFLIRSGLDRNQSTLNLFFQILAHRRDAPNKEVYGSATSSNVTSADEKKCGSRPVVEC